MIGVWMATRLAAKHGEKPERDALAVPDIAWWCLIGVIAGGRLGYVLVNASYFAENPLKIFAIWEGGLVMYGGFILAATLGAWKARQLGLHVWAALDWGLTGGFLGQAIGRIGCLMVGDDFGKPTDVAWALRVPDPLPLGSLFPAGSEGTLLHPAQVYMQLKGVALFLIGVWLLKRKKFHGQVAAILIGGYALLRFVIESFRGDAAARGGIFRPGYSPEEVGPAAAELLISTSQMVSCVVLPLAVWLYLHLARNGRRVQP